MQNNNNNNNLLTNNQSNIAIIIRSNQVDYVKCWYNYIQISICYKILSNQEKTYFRNQIITFFFYGNDEKSHF